MVTAGFQAASGGLGQPEKPFYAVAATISVSKLGLCQTFQAASGVAIAPKAA